MAINFKSQNKRRTRRAARTRSQINGTARRPRLSVFRSNRFIYAQLIDDEAGKTLASATTSAEKKSGKSVVMAKNLGAKIAEKAKAIGIVAVVFDKGAYAYHGRVKAVAESAREAGLKF